ncbi:hypothetical protein DAPPUDRAFT_330595 [Daphnia pulex]|uniref:Chitin-binding type-2 domain-containing protein n=1 Tax=Daphnia pulex TaxID=6669 RepID=E9HK20_DAPPU|nr:hypothetical protein DAPPUDRAFT_330595 [Daphnia pulex]|eukprot:EFX67914.1 hypothetical protein DAPPUDRAFT_330595 [Daphnia pulex]
MKNFASFVCLMLVLVASTSALPGVARAAPQCPENEAGNVVFFPDTTNCQNYYMCSWGVAYLKSCPDNLYWNKNINVCDHQVNVKC